MQNCVTDEGKEPLVASVNPFRLSVQCKLPPKLGHFKDREKKVYFLPAEPRIVL
jgi:hypothetical protein